MDVPAGNKRGVGCPSALPQDPQPWSCLMESLEPSLSLRGQIPPPRSGPHGPLAPHRPLTQMRKTFLLPLPTHSRPCRGLPLMLSWLLIAADR